MENYNASSRDYNDMCRSASRDYYTMERARIERKRNEEQRKVSKALEKANILKQYELKLITREEALAQINALENKQENTKRGFFR